MFIDLGIPETVINRKAIKLWSFEGILLLFIQTLPYNLFNPVSIIGDLSVERVLIDVA